MSLSIDNSKVEELSASLTLGYEVSTSSAEGTIENYAPVYPNYPAGGTTYASYNLVTPESRGNLLALRRRVELSGVPLVSAGELEAELREMRR
jgi:hypothetical protein